MVYKRSHPQSSVRLALRCALAVGLMLTCARTVYAHGAFSDSDGVSADPRDLHDLLCTWGWEPGSLAALALSAALYGIGLRRLWRAAGVGHGVRRWEAACFTGGWLALFVALLSPLHPWGQMLFSAHMAQHEILMLIAAPLLVLGRPIIAVLRALPFSAAGKLARLANRRPWATFWAAVTTPLVAWAIHFIVLWGWHAPALFQATLHNGWVHAAQHTSFLLSALLFWWALLHGRRTTTSTGVAVLYLFTTAIHSGFLGALLTFARTPWYPDYASTTEVWGLSPLDDQQLGGLIMWIPACSVYIIAGLALFADWMRQSEQRVLRREGVAAGRPPAASSMAVAESTIVVRSPV